MEKQFIVSFKTQIHISRNESSTCIPAVVLEIYYWSFNSLNCLMLSNVGKGSEEIGMENYFDN